jgi:hypothetical protein
VSATFFPVPKPAPRPPKEKQRPARVNRPRKSREWLRDFGSIERVLWINAQPCVVGARYGCGKRQNHHVVSRGAGGTYLDVVPLCEMHHGQLHQIGRASFERVYQIDLTKCAVEVAGLWERVRDGGTE